MDYIFFSNWDSIIRTVLLTSLGYFSIVILLRVSGKRTLSKMNAFDFVITIALGSCLATLSLNKNVTLAEGVISLSLLIFLQFLMTWLSVRISKFKFFITSSPTLVFYQGEFLHKVMKEQRITVEEIYNAGRLKGLTSLDNIEMIIFEATGDLSIIERRTKGRINTDENIDFKN
ncbi:MAG: DUF421 domain-containing protein [Bacteroidetes bacterium]|nr:DUF421 domain-containing protein [Bacteroidota bacterium]HET6244542.1 YetF domain-containing protein [Bacteroidia bacterium]